MDREKLKHSPWTHEHRSHNASPSQKTAMPRWRSKGNEKSSVELACTWIVDHQIAISFYLLTLLALIHLGVPRAQHHTRKFFQISYFNPKTGLHALGWDDIFFVFFWIIVFTGMRCTVMDYILTPLAHRAGIHKKKAKVRFAEQAWILLYYGAFWACGMYIMYNSPYWLNLKQLWVGWPIREMGGLAKWYYLVQFAFWLQQIVVVNIEERRKDHWQMFTHHLITCTLIFLSYGYHQTRVGNLILCLMDLSDIFLPLAKILKYLKFNTLCDVFFGVFMITWLMARHILYSMVCWSIYADIPRVIKYGCYHGSMSDLHGPIPVPNDWNHLTLPFRDPEGLVCWNNNTKWMFLGLLGALQVLVIIWFGMILNVAWKVIKGGEAEDTRSDDEDSDAEDEINGADSALSKEETLALEAPIEEDADGETVRLSSAARQGRASPARLLRRGEGNAATTGMSLTGHSDRKELLGRIGCDKGS